MKGFGAAGTVRTTTIIREDLKVKDGTKAQRDHAELNRGLDQGLMELRTK